MDQNHGALSLHWSGQRLWHLLSFVQFWSPFLVQVHYKHHEYIKCPTILNHFKSFTFSVSQENTQVLSSNQKPVYDFNQISVNLGRSCGLSGEESFCQWRGHGFSPWSRRIPHTAEQLSWCTTTAEPVLRAREPQLLNSHAPTTEACTP